MSLAILTNSFAAIPKRVGRTYNAIIMHSEQNRDIMLSQNGKNGGRNLAPQKMNMCDVRMLVLYKLLIFFAASK